ncbi:MULTISPECIES: type II toxin-antitoxin system YafQ family toxin [unclassified Moraxella]|uniref:type II toxin-antitoxin system YafQ family toxin n=1 Tax=unclassified Moraxella TaxID=2685852 RepID=UPI003AF97D78
MANKRTNLPRSSDFTKDFLSDWQRLNKTGRYNMVRLKQVMLLLIANDEPLGAEWLDHELKGNWKNHRECHIGGDFLLIYTLGKIGVLETVVFVRIGTHSELFR